MTISKIIIAALLLITLVGIVAKTNIARTNDYNNLLSDYNVLYSKLNKLTTEYDKIINEENERKAIEEYISIYYKRIPSEIATAIAYHTTNLCKKYSIPYELTLGIMEVESDFNPSAVSDKRARGLMQVLPSFWSTKLNITDEFKLHQVEYGIDTGLQILTIMLKEQKGSMSDTLYMYVGRNKEYVNKVYERMGRFILFKALEDPTQKIPLLSKEQQKTETEIASNKASVADTH